MARSFLSAKEVALISIFAGISSISTSTTLLIPAPLPGLHGVISILVSTVLLLALRTLIDKDGIATFSQFVSGLISTFLPGSPPIKWMMVPAWILGGVTVDALFRLMGAMRNSRLFYGMIGALYLLPGDVLLYWSFSVFLNWRWPLLFFLYGFIMIHALLGLISGLVVPETVEKIKLALIQQRT